MSDFDLETLKAAGGGGGFVALLAGVVAWMRGAERESKAERIREKQEDQREKSEARKEERHQEFIAALQAHTEGMVRAMITQSETQLAGIRAVGEAQGHLFAQAAKESTAALAAKIDALSQTLAETKTDLRELSREVRACTGCAVAPIMGPGLERIPR